MSNGLIVGLYLTGEIGFTVKEKQKAYGKKEKDEGDIRFQPFNYLTRKPICDNYCLSLSDKMVCYNVNKI